MNKFFILIINFTLISTTYYSYTKEGSHISKEKLEQLQNYIDNIKSKIPDIVQNAKNTSNNIKQQLKQEKKQAKLQKETQLKKQNTIIKSVKLSNKLHTGLYNRDLIEAATFGIDSYFNYQLYSSLEKLIENFVLNQILNNSKKWQEELEKAIKDNNFLSNYKLKNFILKQTRVDIKNKYSLFKDNNLCSSIISKLIANKITNAIENKYIIQTSTPHFEKAYFKNNSEFIELEIRPLSILTIIKFISSPLEGISNLLPRASNPEKYLKLINKLFKLNIPEFFFAKNSIRIFQLMLQLTAINTSISLYNSSTSVALADYILHNKSDFLDILKAYNSNSSKKEDIELKLKAFISRNNNTSFVKKIFPISNYIAWNNTRTLGRGIIKSIASLPALGYIGYKAIKWYRNL